MSKTTRSRIRKSFTNSIQRFTPVIRYFMSNLLGSPHMDMGILENYIKLMPLNDRKKLMKQLCSHLGTSENDYASALNEKISSEHEVADIIDDMWRDKRCKLTSKTTVKILTHLWDSAPRYTEKTLSYPKQFEGLKSIFKFDNTDLSILALLYIYNYQEILDCSFDHGETSNSNNLAALAVGISLPELTKRLGPRGSIGASGLLKNSAAPTFTGKGLIEQVQQIFFTSSIETRLGLFSKLDKKESYPLESFTVPSQDTEILIRLLKSSARSHILFHGKPGTGKTELARSLAKASGRKVFMLNMPVDDGAETKRATLLMGIVQAEREEAVLIADEMDFLLNTEALFKIDGADKGWLISLMECYKAKVIWISNSIDAVHEAVLRRFSFSMKFRSCDAAVRLRQWNSLLEKSPARRMISDEMTEEFAARFEANPGAIANALESLAIFAGKRKLGEKQVKTTMEILLKRHLSLTGGRIIPAQKSANPYDLSALNTSMPAERIITAAEGFRDGRIDRGIGVLLHGLSGTGKSAFAAHVAESTGLPLIKKRSSDLLSMYVGGTEANIREAFRDAEDRKGILLIDEVDTFLADRAGARHSWERTQVNELLTCMEEFTGLFFCTTNLKGILDAAVMRRFTFKVEFLPLKGEGRTRLFRKYFPGCSMGSDTPKVDEALERMTQLTPGDFKAAAERLSFSGIPTPTVRQALEELEAEVEVKKERIPRPVGFCGAA